MGEDSCSRGDGSDLLEQFELILERDTLIDEVGFVHLSQLASLDENLNSCLSSSANFQSANMNIPELNALQFDKTAFWNRDHKLAISTQVLPQLYKAAICAYIDASRNYKVSVNSSVNVEDIENAQIDSGNDHSLENAVLKHTKAVLILNVDFRSAWNSRKLVLSRKHISSFFVDELQFSTLLLSYSPKSESAWTHRRWAIKMVAKKFNNLQEIIYEESELVKKIAEKSKMNYRAWSHQCWLTFYMTKAQVLDELNKSRKWAELHVADNCCFHYRRRLLLKSLEANLGNDGETSFDDKSEVCFLLKEELEWNELLVQRYVGREALWIHRRFLSQCWMKHIAANQEGISSSSKDDHHIVSTLDDFLSKELRLVHACLNVSADEFEDTQVQAQLAASYLLWISKQLPLPQDPKLLERLRNVGDLKAMLTQRCPEKTLLWESLLN